MEFRPATLDDYDAIKALADANYIDNLTPEQRKDGFLSARFSRDDVARMASDIGIAVAVEDGNLAGFLGSSPTRQDDRSPIRVATIATFRRSQYRGKAGSEWKCFSSGPLCIASEFRGRDVPRGLHRTLVGLAKDRFEVGVGFIAANNPRSFHTAIEKIGMDVVGEFELNQRRFYVIAFRVADYA